MGGLVIMVIKNRLNNKYAFWILTSSLKLVEFRFKDSHFRVSIFHYTPLHRSIILGNFPLKNTFKVCSAFRKTS